MRARSRSSGGPALMFRHGIWRPAAVAVIMSTAAFLPQGVAVAATPDTLGTVTCSELSVQIRNGSLTCRPLRNDGVDGVFIGPMSPAASPAGGATTGSASVASGSTTSGSTTTTPTTDATPTTATTESSSGDSSDDSSTSSSGSSSSGSSSSGSGSDDSTNE